MVGKHLDSSLRRLELVLVRGVEVGILNKQLSCSDASRVITVDILCDPIRDFVHVNLYSVKNSLILSLSIRVSLESLINMLVPHD